MTIRISELFPLLAIAVGTIVSQSMGFEGPTTAFFSLFAVLATGYLIGSRLIGSSTRTSTAWGSIAALTTLMLLRGAWFYAGGSLNGWSNAWITLVMLALAILFLLMVTPPSEDGIMWRTTWERSRIELLALATSVAGFVLVAYGAQQSSVSNSIRTPWPFLPDWTLILIGLLWTVTLSTAWRTNRKSNGFLQAMCAIAATAVITPLLYRIGYGFDGFLHVAGETILANTGTISPRPPYYMGQYVFVTWISQLFDLEIATVDRWLVPTFAALLIPAALWLSSKRAELPASTFAALVLIPLAPFVATTPHGFATVLGVVALLLCIAPASEQGAAERRPFVPLLIALWSILTHPLVGLPVFCGVLMFVCWQLGNRIKSLRFVSILIALISGISVPLVFGLSAGSTSASVNFDIVKLLNPSAWLGIITGFLPWVPNRYAIWAEASVWIEKLLPWLTLAFAMLALLRKDVSTWARQVVEPESESPTPLQPYDQTTLSNAPWLLASLSTFFAAAMLRIAGDFGFLIDYERGNYADRLFMVALLLLLPLAIPEMGRRLDSAKHGAFASSVAVLAAIGLLGAGASYAALPRHDAVTPSRGWSVGSADIQAVKLIDEDAGDEPYTVLANQSVSAAAVKTFGFKRYNDDVFFYPIPTGGELYDVFLRASYEDPSRETMRDAARLGGSDLVYFVVNDYWWKAPELSEAAASSSDRLFVIEEGKVKVFKYDLNHVSK